MKSYEHLEGAKITWLGGFGHILSAVVVGIDCDIGITIMSEDNKCYLTCSRGPGSPQAKLIDPKDYEHWDDIFNLSVAMIEDGYYDVRKMQKLCNAAASSGGSGPSAKECAFGA